MESASAPHATALRPAPAWQKLRWSNDPAADYLRVPPLPAEGLRPPDLRSPFSRRHDFRIHDLHPAEILEPLPGSGVHEPRRSLYPVQTRVPPPTVPRL